MATKALLTVRETARLLGVHENTVRNWQEKGILRAARLPSSGYRRFDRDEVERLRDQIISELAPATEGPVVQSRRRPRGKLVLGDDLE